MTEERQGQIALKLVKLSAKLNGIPTLDRRHLNAHVHELAREIEINPLEAENFFRIIFLEVARECYPESGPIS